MFDNAGVTGAFWGLARAGVPFREASSEGALAAMIDELVNGEEAVNREIKFLGLIP